ncbi:uncharacterized protein LOC126560583 [Anopheles maculipalpis]|uniref:uncharacterized protein LOC126560583 n=1 Tax=Anopheles maculipalpis TaxID=1496333 RepID=UPI002158B699|nr:uncharacterized protein LOC126560583 [Anopheles maculipalpis]
MLLLAFRSFFFIAVILGYSTGIWRLINDYFRREFQTYLEEESQTNKYLLRDPPKHGPPEATDNKLPAPNRLGGQADHQQVTDSIMTLFETTTTRAAGTDAGASIFANDANGERETQRPGELALRVAAAAEVTDIRPRDDRQGNKMESNRGTEGEEEDKWISYWSRRGRKPDGGSVDSADAYCTINALVNSKTDDAATRNKQRIMPDGDDFGCPN